MIGGNGQSLVVTLDGLIQTSEVGKRHTAIVEDFGVPWIEAQGCGKACKPGVPQLKRVEHETAVVVRLDVVRIDRKHALETRQRLLQALEFDQNDTPAHESGGIAGPDGEDTIILRECLLMPGEPDELPARDPRADSDRPAGARPRGHRRPKPLHGVPAARAPCPG